MVCTTVVSASAVVVCGGGVVVVVEVVRAIVSLTASWMLAAGKHAKRWSEESYNHSAVLLHVIKICCRGCLLTVPGLTRVKPSGQDIE